MQQYADLEDGRAKIADELCPGGTRETLRSLAFDDHSVIDNHVQALPRHELAFVIDRHAHFSVDLVSAQCELVLERPDVRSLAHSSTAVVVEHGEECGNDRPDA